MSPSRPRGERRGFKRVEYQVSSHRLGRPPETMRRDNASKTNATSVNPTHVETNVKSAAAAHRRRGEDGTGWTSSIQLDGLAAVYQFEWGATSALGSRTATTGLAITEYTSAVTAPIGQLTPNRRYY